MKTIIRIKRRADEDPAENIIVKPKRPRFSETGSAIAFAPIVEPTVLERVATVESLEEELDLDVLKSPKIYKKVKELQRHYKKPHTLKGTKARHEAEERKSSKKYKVHASHQGKEFGKEGGAGSKEDVDKELRVKGDKKVVQKSESDVKSDDSPSESSPNEIQYLNVESIQQMDDVIFCNGEPMQSEKYVYDIYYSSNDVNWAEYTCEIQKYVYDSDDGMSYYDFDDEDDENDENNWRNDYPDEDDDSSFEDEEDYLQRCLCKSSSRYHLDDSSDEAQYEEENFDVEGNLIHYDKNPILRFRHYAADIQLESDSD